MKTSFQFKTSVLAASAFALALCMATQASHAANITWGAPTTISADTNIVNTGQTIGAFRLGNTGLAAATVNGVTFMPLGVADGTTTVTSGNFTLNLGNSASTNTEAGSTAAPYSNLSADMKSLLQAGTFSSNNLITLTMGGLLVGQAYTFEWLTNNSGVFSSYAGALTRATGGTGVVTLDANTSASNTFGGIGQFATGTFTANATSQVVTFVSTNDFAYLTAFQLRGPVAAVPEPSSWALLAAGAGLMGVVVRRLRAPRHA